MLSLPTLAERGEAVEQFRSLRSHIYQLRYQSPLKTILISSGMPSEGKALSRPTWPSVWPATTIAMFC